MSKLNVVCLTPVRNEAWILDRFLKCASVWADHIIIADQMSDDGSREIARSYSNVTLIDNPSTTFNEPGRQAMLLNAARRIPSPRLLVTLDADEMITANFLSSPEWQTVLEARTGTVVYFKLVNLRPGAAEYWSPDFLLPLAFKDDGTDHVGSKIHSTRIPLPKGAPEIKLQEIKLLHYQFTDWERMESKHRWYQCWERQNNPERHPIDIYRQYHHMYAIPRTDIHPLPAEWISGYEERGIDMRSVFQQKRYWWDREVLKLLAETGPTAFRRESIWDVDWPARNRQLENVALNSDFADPRDWLDKRVQWWLRKTQPVHETRPVRVMDRLIKAIYR